MAQKTGLHQGQVQKLGTHISPMQLQVIKMIQYTTAEFEEHFRREVEENPALDEPSNIGNDDDYSDNLPPVSRDEYQEYNLDANYTARAVKDDDSPPQGVEVSLDELSFEADDMNDYKDYDYKVKGDEDYNTERYEAPIIQRKTLHDSLTEQIESQISDETDHLIAMHLIGSIDLDGYLRYETFGNDSILEHLSVQEARKLPLQSINDQLKFTAGVYVELERIEKVLRIIQNLDPVGVGARDLQECLLLQLKSRTGDERIPRLCRTMIESYYEDFTKRHYNRLKDRMGLNDDDVREMYNYISKLNPKPGESESEAKTLVIVPDFILTVENDEIIIRLNRRNTPELRVNQDFIKLIKDFNQEENSTRKNEEYRFALGRVDQAKALIAAIRQRQTTLLNTMSCIALKQREFFLNNDETLKLQPMILADVADSIGMDVSTVSRVTSNKYVQTEYGLYRLGTFFSEGIKLEGKENEFVSNVVIQKLLSELIQNEDKSSPLADDDLREELIKMGYNIARRTVSKYRESLQIPVSRLRKRI